MKSVRGCMSLFSIKKTHTQKLVALREQQQKNTPNNGI